MENDKKECRAYFLERSVYKKLFAKIQEKYAGIGHFGGTFLLDDLTKEEKEQLGGFLQKDFSGQKNVRVTAKQMEKALQSSRFCNFTWEEILELYTGRALLVKKEEKQKEEQKRESWFQNIQLQLKNPDFRNWISEVLQNRKESYLFLLQQYKENKKELEDFLAEYSSLSAKKIDYSDGDTISVQIFRNDKETEPQVTFKFKAKETKKFIFTDISFERVK